jgi:phage tail protein X
MKLLRLTLPLMLLSISVMAFAQSDAQKSFDEMKTLAGNWQGAVTLDPQQSDMGDMSNVQISLRVTSRGNAIVHEMGDLKPTDDPTKHDHPVTMFYLDGNHLNLVHYCDAGNRPHMIARSSPDGKTIDFDFVDVSGSTQYGHMQHATFTVIDANHHTEEWTYLMPGDKPVHARMDLKRVQ